MVEAVLYPSVGDIPEWDEVCAPTTMQTAAWWLRDSEEIFAESMRPTYVVVREGDRTLGATSCWTVPRPGVVAPPLEASRLFSRWELADKQLAKTYAATFPPEALYPFTICGAPRGHAGSWIVRPELDGAARTRVLAKLLGEAEDQARRAGAKLVVVPYLGLDDAVAALAAEPRLVAGYAIADAYLSPVPAFDEYLASFARHRRKRILEDVKRFEQEGLRSEVRPLSAVAERTAELIVGATKFGMTASQVYGRKDLALVAERGDARSRVFCALRGDEIVGVTYCICEHGVYYARSVGVDPNLDKRGALYFNTSYYAPIRHAAQDGVREIHYGGGSLEVKYRRGCRFRPRWNLVLPLVEWDEATRELLRGCGESLLATDRATLGALEPSEPIDEILGVARAPAALVTR